MDRRLTMPEKRADAVLKFMHENTEAHVETLMSLLNLPPGVTWADNAFSEAMRYAKNMGLHDYEMELCPVYERHGWWTSDPSDEVRHVARHKAIKRNATEEDLNARLGNRFARRDYLTGIVGSVAGYLASVEGQLAARLPDRDREDDPCLNRIDALMA